MEEINKKDNKKLIRKFIITFIVFMLSIYILGIFTGKAYASTPYPTIPEAVTGNYIIVKHDTYYNLFTITAEVMYKTQVTENGNTYDAIYIGGGPNYMYQVLPNGQWSTRQDLQTGVWQTHVYLPTGTTADIQHSTRNIYSNSNMSGVFFSLHPTQLQQLVQPQVLHPVLSQILAILPILIILLVGFLGLRKALRILQMFLHQA